MMREDKSAGQGTGECVYIKMQLVVMHKTLSEGTFLLFR